MAEQVEIKLDDTVKTDEKSPEVKEETPPVTTETTEKKEESKAETQEDVHKKNQEAARLRIERRNKERALELENAKLKGKLEALEEIKKPEKQGYSVPEPNPEAFETVAQYAKAVAIWDNDRRDFERQEAAKTTEVKTEQQKFVEKVTAQRVAGETKYEDFEDVVGPVQYPITIFNEIMDSEIGHDISYYLGKNPAELDRISVLPPNRQIKEIARLEDKIRAGVQVQTKSSAPPPPPVVQAGANASESEEKAYLDDKTSAAERIRLSQARKMAALRGK